MAVRALPAPEVPLDSDGDVALRSTEITDRIATAEHGTAGCVVCQRTTVHVLALHELADMLDADTDARQVVALDLVGDRGAFTHTYRRTGAPESWRSYPPTIGLHPLCVPALMEGWGWVVHGDLVPDRADDALLDATEAITRAGGAARRQGAYGRRRRR